MSETTPSSEPVTGPIDATPPPPDYRRPSRVNVAAAWVGIVAGVVFIVSIIFGTGFILGAHSGGPPRGGGPGGGQEFHQGPPMGPMGPMGPMFRPGPGFPFPGGPGGPGGFPGGPAGPGESSTSPTPATPTQPGR